MPSFTPTLPDTLLISLECDKSFTRSDALAKHMRTVHEIETGRPPDALGRMLPGPDQKLKRRRSPPYPERNGDVEDDGDDDRSDGDENGPTRRYRYLKRKLRWATERHNKLQTDLQDAEALRWQNWVAKEALLDCVFEKANINLT